MTHNINESNAGEVNVTNMTIRLSASIDQSEANLMFEELMTDFARALSYSSSLLSKIDETLFGIFGEQGINDIGDVSQVIKELDVVTDGLKNKSDAASADMLGTIKSLANILQDAAMSIESLYGNEVDLTRYGAMNEGIFELMFSSQKLQETIRKASETISKKISDKSIEKNDPIVQEFIKNVESIKEIIASSDERFSQALLDVIEISKKEKGKERALDEMISGHRAAPEGVYGKLAQQKNGFDWKRFINPSLYFPRGAHQKSDALEAYISFENTNVMQKAIKQSPSLMKKIESLNEKMSHPKTAYHQK